MRAKLYHHTLLTRNLASVVCLKRLNPRAAIRLTTDLVVKSSNPCAVHKMDFSRSFVNFQSRPNTNGQDACVAPYRCLVGSRGANIKHTSKLFLCELGTLMKESIRLLQKDKHHYMAVASLTALEYVESLCKH